MLNHHKTHFRTVSCWLILWCLIFLASSGWALSLDEAKNKGWLGERPDGYLGKVTDEAPKEAITLMKDINGKRKKAYKKIAEKNKTDLESIQFLAGEKAQKKTESGNYILLPSGEWSTKP